jgi:activator of HSP90 ATPase
MLDRRRMLGGAAIALGCLATASECWARPQQSAAKDAGSSTGAGQTSLHYRVDLKASPQRVYQVLLDAKLFAALTALPAEIDARPGGWFSLFSKQIEGRIVELAPHVRIVQAWRAAHWEAGVYSIVRFALTARGAEAAMVLDHTGFPQGDADGLNSGWHEHYLEPMQKYFQ